MNQDFSLWLKSHLFTVSELESFPHCPFGFYAGSYQKLKPVPEREPEFTAAEIGTLLHRILEKFFQKKNRDADEILKITDLEIQKMTKGRDHLIPVLIEQQRSRIERTLTHFVEREQQERATDLKPTYFEWSFGPENPLEITDPHGTIRVTGRIDRIDVDPKAKQFMVIDYKTGSQKITGKKILAGEALQLPIYILAVQKRLLPDYQPIGGLYDHLADGSLDTGILHAERIPSGLEVSPRSSTIVPAARWEGLFSGVEEQVRKIVAQIRTGEFASTPDSCNSWCPFRDICRIRAPTAPLPAVS